MKARNRSHSIRKILPAERRFEITTLLRKQPAVTTSELAGHFQVSEMTIRRDLGKLETDGLLAKAHGGAMSTSMMASGPSFLEKETVHLEEKRRIGLMAASLVESEDIIAVNAGTTTLHVARSLPDHQGLTVITNAVNIAMELATRQDIRVIVTGGTLRRRAFALVGASAEEDLRSIRVNKVFLGVNGVSVEHGVTTGDLLEVSVDKAMIAAAKEVIVVADHSKFNTVSLASAAPLTAVDKIVTDSGISEEDRRTLEMEGIEVIIATQTDNDQGPPKG